jgi:hypothetical protein
MKRTKQITILLCFFIFINACKKKCEGFACFTPGQEINLQFNLLSSGDVFLNNYYNIDSLKIYDTNQNKLIQFTIKTDSSLTQSKKITFTPNWGNNINTTYLIRFNSISEDTLSVHCKEVQSGSECICTFFEYDKVEFNQNKITPINSNSFSVIVQ